MGTRSDSGDGAPGTPSGRNKKGGPNGAAQVQRNKFRTTTAQHRGGRTELRAAGRRP